MSDPLKDAFKKTTLGYRRSDGSMWVACNHEPDKKPGIALCDFPGNWVTNPHYKLVAVFENEADRDFVLALHSDYLTKREADNGD